MVLQGVIGGLCSAGICARASGVRAVSISGGGGFRGSGKLFSLMLVEPGLVGQV